VTHDATVRPVLRAELQRLNPGAMVVDELGLELGGARVDLAVIGEALHGFEIKAEADTLERLPVQAVVYGRTLDLVTVVAGANHLAGVLAAVPPWWGVWKVQSPGFRVERAATGNPEFSLVNHLQLLWKGELAALFERHGFKAPPSRWCKVTLRHALVERVAPNVLRADVRAALRARGDWRARSRMAPAARAAAGEGT
jgi:hypothetical protein